MWRGVVQFVYSANIYMFNYNNKFNLDPQGQGMVLLLKYLLQLHWIALYPFIVLY